MAVATRRPARQEGAAGLNLAPDPPDLVRSDTLLLTSVGVVLPHGEDLELRLDLSDSAAVGVVDLAADGTIVAANGAFGSLVASSDPVGSSLDELLGDGSPSSRWVVSMLLEAAVPGHEPLEATVVLPNGDRRCLELRPVARIGETGDPTGITVTVTDRSARSEAEAEATRLRAIFEDIVELIGIMAPDGTVLSMNPAAVEFFGSEANQRGLLQFVPPSRASFLFEEILPSLAEHDRWEGETDLLRHDGVEVPHHVTLQRHPSDVPDEDYWWAVARDTSMARRAAEAEALEILNESKDQFIAGISHELRTPLTTIRGFADILATAPVDEPQLSEFIGIIQREAHAMSGIVEDLLVAARADSRQVSVTVYEVEARTLVEEVAHGLRGPDRPIENRVEGGVTVMVDDLRLRQIIRNLVVNTIRHGGDRTWIESEVDADRVRIHVCDNGPGVAPTLHERMFEPYVSRPNDGRRPESVGLGLTVCRQLARLMGGDIQYSYRGHSRFTLELPGTDVVQG